MKSYFSIYTQQLLFLCSFLGMLFFAQFAFAQSELPEGFGDYRSIPKEMIEPGKVYGVAFQPPKFQEFIWKDSVLLLEQNEHLLKDLKLGEDYIIQTETILIKSEYINWTFKAPEFENAVDYTIGDTIFYDKNKWYYQGSLAIVPMQKSLKHNMLSTPNENLILWGFYESSTNEYQEFIRNDKSRVDAITSYKAIKHYFPTRIDTFRTIYFLKNIQNDSLQFSSISIFRMTKVGTFMNTWREVLCSHCYHNPLTINVILKMQKVLDTKGYNVPLNNVFDDITKKALLQFQKDNNLEQGQLSTETWKALGLPPIYHD